MGLGKLGAAAAHQLLSQGFAVAGWSRSAKRCRGSRASSAAAPCRRSCTPRHPGLPLPLTAETRGILDAQTFASLHGAFVINVARGGYLVEADLVAALDSDHLGGATLDVFQNRAAAGRGSPLWSHPKVLITPHVASYCLPATAAGGVVDNIRRARAGQPLRHQVDRSRGYYDRARRSRSSRRPTPRAPPRSTGPLQPRIVWRLGSARCATAVRPLER